MLQPVSGDILLTGAQVIAHGVAVNDPMTQGLARSLRERYPAMHKDYHHWCHQDQPHPGDVWMWGGTGGVRIVNLITRSGSLEHGSKPGKATEKAVRDALRGLARLIAEENFTSLALPRLATGAGGLSWNQVWPIVEERLSQLSLPIYIYTEYHAGQRADETMQ